MMGNKHERLEPHTPTIAPVVPRKTRRGNGFSATNPSENDEKLAYVNMQTPCPSHAAVRISRVSVKALFALWLGGPVVLWSVFL
jgi:hypothetical protein